MCSSSAMSARACRNILIIRASESRRSVDRYTGTDPRMYLVGMTPNPQNAAMLVLVREFPDTLDRLDRVTWC